MEKINTHPHIISEQLWRFYKQIYPQTSAGVEAFNISFDLVILCRTCDLAKADTVGLFCYYFFFSGAIRDF